MRLEDVVALLVDRKQLRFGVFVVNDVLGALSEALCDLCDKKEIVTPRPTTYKKLLDLATQRKAGKSHNDGRVRQLVHRHI